MPYWSPVERAFVNALDEPAVIIDGNLVAVANPAARKLLGSSIEGRDVRLAIRHPQALDCILDHRSCDVEVTGIGQAGRPWRLVVRKIGDASALVRMFDLAEVVAAERMRVDFVANASHELRTPLSAISGYAETIAEETDVPAEVRTGFARTILIEARRMLRLVEDLMSLSRIEADRFVMPSEQVSVSEIIQSAVANATASGAAGRCKIEVDLPDDLPLICGDRGQLMQVLDNLISNACRYGCDGPGCPIHITARRAERWVVVTVADEGSGIPREHLPRVTERFYRVDESRGRDSGGTGLGLAIVKHIIERHQGSLDIKSTLGLGTTVEVRLPASF